MPRMLHPSPPATLPAPARPALHPPARPVRHRLRSLALHPPRWRARGPAPRSAEHPDWAHRAGLPNEPRITACTVSAPGKPGLDDIRPTRVLLERGEQRPHHGRITVPDRRVEEVAHLGGQFGTVLRGEGRVVVGIRAAAAPRGPAVLAVDQAQEQAGPGCFGQRDGCGGARPARGARRAGWDRRLRLCGCSRVVGCARHGWAPQAAGKSDTAGHDSAHRAAEPTCEARSHPLAGWGSKAGDVECCCHVRNLPGERRLYKRGGPARQAFFPTGVQTNVCNRAWPPPRASVAKWIVATERLGSGRLVLVMAGLVPGGLPAVSGLSRANFALGSMVTVQSCLVSVYSCKIRIAG